MTRLGRVALVGGVLLTCAASLGARGSAAATSPAAASAREVCSATRALVVRSDQLGTRLVDPAPDGIDRAGLRRELAGAFRRAARAARAGSRYLADLPAPADRDAARARTAAEESLDGSARGYDRRASAVAQFPIQDRDDWTAAVNALRTKPDVRSGRAALIDLRRAVRNGPRGRAILAAGASDPTCAGSLVPKRTG